MAVLDWFVCGFHQWKLNKQTKKKKKEKWNKKENQVNWHLVKSDLIGLVWFGFFVWWRITQSRLLNAEDILGEQWWYYLTHSKEGLGVYTFPKGISLKWMLKRGWNLKSFTMMLQSSMHNTLFDPLKSKSRTKT